MRREYTEEQVSALAERAYGSNPSFRIRLNRCVLLVIDMQEEFVKPRWTPY